MAEDPAGIVYGDPGGPALDLPRVEAPPRPRTRVEITPDPFAGAPEFKPRETKPSPPPVAGFDPFEGAPEFKGRPPEKPKRADPGALATFGREALGSAMFGTLPVVQGLHSAAEAGKSEDERDFLNKLTSAVPGPIGPAIKPMIGMARMIHEYFANHDDHTVREAYNKGREDSLEQGAAGYENHPFAYWGGTLTGGLATPALGALKAGSLGARTLGGMRAGGLGGLGYGVGTSLSESLDAEDAAKRTLLSGLIGTGAGAGFSAAFGPRLAGTGPGAQAARTAEDLGAPLPKGIASDRTGVQGLAARALSVPVLGASMQRRIDAAGEAGMNRLGQISNEAIGPADHTLSQTIAAGKQAQGAAYDAAYRLTDPDAHYMMPRTRAAVDEVARRRAEAHHENPMQGLEQFDRAANGSNVQGAHRVRSDARDAGDVLNPNPGYNAGDYNYITQAMTHDLRDMVGAAAARQVRNTGGNRQLQRLAAARALREYDRAEENFGRIAEQNKYLRNLRDKAGGGEGENVLANLGFNNATNRPSLGKFVTEWNKMKEPQRNAMFDPQHQREIDQIVNLGEHIKWALRDQNTSKTAGVLIAFDLARDAILLGAAKGGQVAAGHAGEMVSPEVGAAAAVGTGITMAGTALLYRWLASPQVVRPLGAWMRAYRGVTNSPTPLRMAAFQAATRNLSHNIGVPPERLLEHAHAWATGQNEDHADVK